MEKQYLISEEKLKQKLEHLQKAGFIIGVDKVMMDFILKSKTPVEVIASGEIYKPIQNIDVWMMGDNRLHKLIDRAISKFEGKSGTLIFVEDKEIK